MFLAAMALTTMAQTSPNRSDENTAGNVTDERLFTEEQVFWAGTEYGNFAVKNMLLTWWGDELIHKERQQCYIVDKKKGTEKVLFTKEELNDWLAPDSTFKQSSLRNVEFPYADKPLVMIANESSGYALVDFKKKKLVWKLFAKDNNVAESFTKESRQLAYVNEGNIYIQTGISQEGAQRVAGKVTKITTDGDDDNIVYGQAVHRNEWGIMSGLFWSPDGKQLAFYRMDQSMVQNYPLPTFLQGDRVKDTKTRYPMAGDVSHKVTIGVYNTENEKLVYLDAGDPTDRFFTNIAWSPDNKRIYLFEVNREQNKTKLDAYCAESGKFIETIYREESDKYVEPLVPIAFLPWNSEQFVLTTRSTGYNHLYIYNVKGEKLRELTQGEYEVTELVGFCKERHSVIYKSREAGFIYENLYAVNVDNASRVALDNGIGKHGGGYSNPLSESGKWLFDSWTAHDTPRNIDLISTDGCKNKAGSPKAVRLLTAEDPWASKHQPIFESGIIKAADGKTDLCYRMVKPYNFDASKKYPAVVYVYGGPHARNVDDAWHYASRAWETIMSQKGYVCFIIDNRGSEGRGLEFEQAIWHQLGKVEMEDQMKGVEFLKSLPFIDSDRLGVHGWSYGGFMTCSLMTTYPDVFKVGVAGGPVIDWKWYEIMYGERYMGTPQSNPEGYKNSSLLYKAGNLKGRLLIITGGSDPTVVPQNCLNFINNAEQCGKQVDFYNYPDEGHNMAGHKQVTLHKRITQYFEDFLK